MEEMGHRRGVVARTLSLWERGARAGRSEVRAG
jgi:hypothetical protein